MPTAKKTLMFLSGFVTSLGAFVITCVVLATPYWVTGKIQFHDGQFSNGSVIITYGLFLGETSQDVNSGVGQSDQVFEVLKVLSVASPRSLHSLVIVLLFLSLITSLLSSGLTLFNTLSNPYQTWLGPTSIFVWNGLNMTLTVLAMILFAVNTQVNGLSTVLSSALYTAPKYTYGQAVHLYQYSFWLLLLVVFFNAATIVVLVFYQNARYHRKQEHRKPLENAPRDGILF